MLEAGRELDALVAEKVMGWERVEGVDINRREGVPEEKLDADRWHCRRAWFVGNERKACEECGTLPTYSTDIAAAWEAVEKVLPDFLVDLTYWHIDSPHVTLYRRNDSSENYSGIAPTAPLAICLAALKAVGYEPKESA